MHDQAAEIQRTTRFTSAIRGTRASFLSARCRRTGQKIGCLDAQDARQAIDDIDAGRIDASLECADISSVNFRAMGQFFLRQATGLPELSQIDRQYPAYVHTREATFL